ncbi:hypothetical protein NOVO_04735 [Rickettsiales bacterium Ac37b]|nr:hypothetical protein NOVO_04735 [Rickettsiales bacterium Ac37b]
MSDETKNIIDFWSSVEKFTLPKIDNNKVTENLVLIEKEVQGNYNLPWAIENQQRLKLIETEEYTFFHTVFLGITKCRNIGHTIKTILNIKSVDIMEYKEEDSNKMRLATSQLIITMINFILEKIANQI